MNSRKAYELAVKGASPALNKFYGEVGDAGIGAGVIVNNVRYPSYLADKERFGVLEGLVLILTHECDLDEDNDRLWNDSAVVCPIIPLEQFVFALEYAIEDIEAERLIANITARKVNRLMYMPIIPGVLPLGGYMYLNTITSTHRSMLERSGTDKVAMISGFGLREVDLALERHFRRPKADRTPFEVHTPN